MKGQPACLKSLSVLYSLWEETMLEILHENKEVKIVNFHAKVLSWPTALLEESEDHFLGLSY
jgi:hypothetical protein